MAGSDLDLETMLAQLSICVVTGKRIVLLDEDTAPLGRIHVFAARSLRVPCTQLTNAGSARGRW